MPDLRDRPTDVRPSIHPAPPTLVRPLAAAYGWLVAALVAAATLYGLLADDPYRDVTALTRQTWRAQDAVTLAAVLVLLWAAHLARHGSLRAHVVTVGLFLWLTYGYAHLAVGAPFNRMFLVYLAILGLSGWAALDGLLRIDVTAVSASFARAPYRAAAWFLAVSGAGIALLWLGDIVPGLADGQPANLHLADLPNPTWVFDLAWIIPMAVGAAVLLWRRHAAGPVVAGALLVMLLVLSLAMLTIVPFALATGIDSDPDVGRQLVVFSVVFTLLGAIEAWLLGVGARRMTPVDRAWQRPSWWP